MSREKENSKLFNTPLRNAATNNNKTTPVTPVTPTARHLKVDISFFRCPLNVAAFDFVNSGMGGGNYDDYIESERDDY
ncbi:22710_t:CDS:2 [Entrophospora sp. SA101]|nr:9817_t:CDS:2 [Entrophospora sp. SA101]CAJ0651313.1 6574_t:CDS:2 [Entrophospora sp. SA101]CAJ0750409.1 1712_t:CDS:2 [Entrophospora sp. SA101]CAJ0750410.1 1713_t:CDS:2 [Entrophospora sp. SA101]CAJ0768984.1 22710_t:CDS:2 [Entrophospora sp. SA101]